MDKVTYFDVEYANSKNKSICQIGLMCEDFNTGEPFYPELNIYINPEDRFDEMCVKIHGITADRVENEMCFPEVWKDIEKYFTNAVVVGHNVDAADLDALTKTLRRYHIDIPEFYYICTYKLAKEFIPSFAIDNFKMSTLCRYFDIDIDSEHDAFDDACANADLFRTLIDVYSIEPDEYIKKYSSEDSKNFVKYISDVEIRKAVSEFYGIVRGFSIDNIINSEEITYIKEWRNKFNDYCSHKEIADIVEVIDNILDDGMVTANEIIVLQSVIKKYLDILESSPITLATQILDGILKGITVDGEITSEECNNLRQWLYDNIYLAGHFPFDKIMKVIDEVLQDSVITKEESAYITSVIDSLLNPVDSIKSQVISVNGKHVCLTGNFAYGSKSDVQNYIVEHGGMIDNTVKKITDILIVGKNECQSYSNGTYGTKIKKAIEYIEKGCTIQIVKENDFFSVVK